MANLERGSGILLHPTSLASKYGIGELGGSIFEFLDLVAECRQKYWQVLPLGPTGFGDSPYQAFSSFAGNPLLISIEVLVNDGLLDQSSVSSLPAFQDDRVVYGLVIPEKEKLLRKAYKNFNNSNQSELIAKFSQFKDKHKSWLDNYALFMALKNKFNNIGWIEWDLPYRNPNSEEVREFATSNTDHIEYYKFRQFIFDLQWFAVKEYANSKGIAIIGDVPIYVAHDSVDCWVNQSYFLLNQLGEPTVVSGVPPDHFSPTGQLWGNPIYDWNKLQADDFDFWVQRMKRTFQLVDIVRLDHFRGFEAYWEVPADHLTAEKGRWVKGPGEKIFDAIFAAIGDKPIIAEDLGTITPEVDALRKKYSLPSMRILQYAFTEHQDTSNTHLPDNYTPDVVVYPGTHDNNTTKGWFATVSSKVKRHFIEYTGSNLDDVVGDMIELALSSKASIAIIPMQDILRLNSSARMNFPGKPYGNWQWRLTESHLNDNSRYFDQLRQLTLKYSR